MIDRQNLVTRKSLCFNCLGSHKLNECRSLKRCRKCKGQHHTLLHRDTALSSKDSPISSASPSTSSSSSSNTTPSSGSSHSTAVLSHTAAAHLQRSQVLLATACVTLINLKGDNIKVRALLDQGSEISIVQESLVQLLRLPRTRASVPIMGIGAHNIGASRGVVTLRLQSRHDPSIEFSAFILPKVTGRIPSRQVTASWNHVRGLQLADPEFATPGPIDIILGADVYDSLLLGDIRRESLNSPVAQHTTLGWIVSGPLNAQSSSSDSASIISCCKLQDVDLHDTLQKFWIQEDVIPSITSSSSVSLQTSKPAKIIFAPRTLATRPGDISFGCLFAYRPPEWATLPSASRSFARVRQRIRRDEVFGKLYSDFLQEYADLGHMVPTSSASQHHLTPVYLPHHGVLRESSSTTKLRVVFNGSAPTSSGISLNDCLHAGPKLQQDLDAVILRWRMHAFAFAADIEKMYRQIVTHPEDRHYQQILWGTSDSPRSYQLTTVTYGLTCAPYLALRVLQQLATDEERLSASFQHRADGDLRR